MVPAGVASRVIPATVPGCIHTDLIDAGLIRDPRIGAAESEIQWVSWADWRYELEFDADPTLFERDEIDLVFEHLDTIASIELNGVEVGKAASEFLPHRFSVVDVLRQGKNRLAVTFTSPLRFVKEESARLGARPVNGDYPAYNMIRKCASNFEWDWGPRVATCGIAGGVRVEGWSVVRIRDSAVQLAKHEPGSWKVAVDVSLEWSRRGLPQGTVLIGSDVNPEGDAKSDQRVVARGCEQVRLSLVAHFVDGWAPSSHGAPVTYPFELWLTDNYERGSDWIVDDVFEQQSRLGFRDVVLDTSLDERGNAFTIRINGRSVFCRGANWIPEGLFPRDRTPERVRERLEQLKAANMNMIRVWGGGRYEPDWFYDICDEFGIMVWQDSMLACACYPEEEPIRSLVAQEARYHVARLARHPSVVLWCGGNECTWAHESWGFKEKLAPGQTWGEKYYNEILPRVCAEVNPSVPYIPNSPFSIERGQHPNDPTQGDTHVWDVWGEGYRTVVPRFCSEFGQQGPSCVETLQKAGLAPLADARGSDSVMPPLLAARQRGPGGNKRWYDDPIAAWFRPPRDFDEWHYLAQLLQARSLQIGIEWQRANMPRCMGSLVWQLNDAWPGLSWSLIDSDGRPKLAYHAVAAAFKNRKLTIQPIDGELQVVAINDTDEPWTSRLRLRRMSFDGTMLVAPDTRPFSIPARRATGLCRVEEIVGSPTNPDQELIVAESLKHRATWYYLPDHELRYPAPEFEASLTNHPMQSTLTLTSRVLMRDIVIHSDRLVPAAPFQPPPYTALPGEKLVIGIYVGQDPSVASRLTVEKLTSRPVFWCANHFGKPTNA